MTTENWARGRVNLAPGPTLIRFAEWKLGQAKATPKSIKAVNITSAPGNAWTSSTLSRNAMRLKRGGDMPRVISFKAVGQATSLFLAITFVLCVAFDLLFPAHAMFQVWENLLPGFHWISWKSFVLGLIESYGYGWYFTLIWVPLYNVFCQRETGATS
jgi:hypothetical protein